MAMSSTKALTGLRIAVGILFLIFGEYKVFGTQFTMGGGFQYWIGQQSETEVLQAEVEAEQADLAVVSSEHMRRRAMTALAAVVGNPSG